jgi:hypothetical protein
MSIDVFVLIFFVDIVLSLKDYSTKTNHTIKRTMKLEFMKKTCMHW